MTLATLLSIVTHTPPWVWFLLALLVALGLLCARTRRTPLHRALLMPLAITGLSLHGTFTAFHGAPVAIVVWGGAALLSAAWFATGEAPAGTRYDPARRVFLQPGSWMPLATMMAIFTLRYAVAASLAVQPQWAQQEGVAALAASLYGALSGVLLGRTLRLLRLARHGGSAPAGAPARGSAWG